MPSGTGHRSWGDVAAQQAYDDHLRRLRDESGSKLKASVGVARSVTPRLAALFGFIATATLAQLAIVGPVARLIEDVATSQLMIPRNSGALVDGACVSIGLLMASLGWFGCRDGIRRALWKAFMRTSAVYLGLHFTAYGVARALLA